MTVYFNKVFKKISDSTGWYFRSYQWAEQDTLLEDFRTRGGPMLLMTGSHFNNSGRINHLPENFVGSHIIRDPRDLLVSGYRYHKWCKEEWATVTMPQRMRVNLRLELLDISRDTSEFSYQDLLNYLDQETGILVELNWRRGHFRNMMDWDYQNPRIKELRYEDIFGDEINGFNELFRHYGFSNELAVIGMKYVRKYSFARQKRFWNRRRKKHLSKGISGQWRDLFNDTIKGEFKKRHQYLLEKLGYERDNSW